jgi:hypothetical protein
MFKTTWVQTVACTRPVPKPRISKWQWSKIYEDRLVQFWVCEQDLKEQFVSEAKLAFGKALDQVVALGNGAGVLYCRNREGQLSCRENG